MIKHSIELNPGNAWTHANYACILVDIGKTSESILEIKHALKLDPLSIYVNEFYAHILLTLCVIAYIIEHLQIFIRYS